MHGGLPALLMAPTPTARLPMYPTHCLSMEHHTGDP
jgi:hypothetical protein